MARREQKQIKRVNKLAEPRKRLIDKLNVILNSQI